MAALTAFAKLAAQWFCQFMKDLRLALSELIRFLFHGLWEPLYIIRKLFVKEVRRSVLKNMIFVFAAYALGGALVFKCSVWAGSVYLVMLRYLLPLALLTAAILAGIYNVDAIAFRLIFLLVVSGLMTQTSLDTSTAAELLRHHFVATAAGMLGAVGYFYFSQLEPRCMIRLLNTLSLLMYGVLLLMPASHGTRNWLYVGATSLQLTEIARLFAVISVARACTMPEKSDKERTILVFETISSHLGCLILVNELSTAVIIFFTATVLLLLSVRQLRWTALGLGATGLAGYIVYLTCKLCFQLGGGGIFKGGSLIYQKLISRLHPETSDGFQLNAAHKSLLLSGWFGSSADVYIPAADTDFVLVSGLRIFGYTFFFIIMFLMFALLMLALVNIDHCSFPGLLSLACILSLNLQFCCNSASALGIGPIMGLTCPFLSLGGTSLACTFFLSGILLASSSDIAPAMPHFFYKRGTKNE